jgi:integrase/recombinase XerD
MLLGDISVSGFVQENPTAPMSQRHCSNASLPCVLKSTDSMKTLKSVDRSTATGKRDYAILQILKTFGLRGGEVAQLSLDDIDWRNEVLHVRRRKNCHPLELPLLTAVARAIVAYLKQSRAKHVKTRILFLSVSAPYRAMTTGAISRVVAEALTRAGVQSVRRGSHIFRHYAELNISAIRRLCICSSQALI